MSTRFAPAGSTGMVTTTVGGVVQFAIGQLYVSCRTATMHGASPV